MTIKAYVESLDGIDEALKSHYVEKDGGFHLDLEDFGKHPGAVTLKKTLDRLNKEKDTLSAQAAEWRPKIEALPDDFDAAEWDRLRAGDKPDAQIDAMKDQHARAMAALKARHKAELDTLHAQAAERESALDATMSATALQSALDEAGFDPVHKPMLTKFLADRIKVRREDDGRRVVYADTDIGEATPVDFVKGFGAKAGAVYLSKASGSPAPGSNGVRSGEANPFTRQHWNKTAQAHLPAERREMMAIAAGFKDANAALSASAAIK